MLTYPSLCLALAFAGTGVAQNIPLTSLFPANKPAVATAPVHLFESGYAFGRWKAPIEDVRFESEVEWTHALEQAKIKRWHYTSVNTADYLVAFTIVSLPYAAPVFVYIVDKHTAEKWEFATNVPLSAGVHFAASSVDSASCTSYASLWRDLSFCFDERAWHMTLDGIHVTSDRTKNKLPLSFDLSMTATDHEPLILSFPLANDPLRPAYVHKGAGYRVHGALTLGEKRIDFSDALGAVDWTKSIALHHTEWNWVSSSFKTDDGKAVGINLSARVYDVDGASQENALWVDGKLCLLGGVSFAVPAHPVTDTWTIRSKNATALDAVDLEFTPVGARQEQVNVLNVVRSAFVQPYGRFTGHITCTMESGETHRIRLRDTFGVVEDHQALW
ncbi:Aste57867_24355 [Aphanomyces stellatus]|uniref:Aste57867_24355 protein n=1 Tax=Aphanomyces stellatus TaxID=120398 RepID=A0A485LRS6_9STRA|nr:hypothetical protein As57867_024279 [Aphanomyces stellatus]VFU00995.1 Aste57867_24355 [Aphanomyces stellatus]